MPPVWLQNVGEGGDGQTFAGALDTEQAMRQFVDRVRRMPVVENGPTGKLLTLIKGTRRQSLEPQTHSLCTLHSSSDIVCLLSERVPSFLRSAGSVSQRGHLE